MTGLMTVVMTVVAAVVTAALQLAVPHASAADNDHLEARRPQHKVVRPATGEEIHHCNQRLARAAKPTAGYSYHYSITSGVELEYVGALPAHLAAVVEDVRKTCIVRVKRVIYTSRQLKRAVRKIDPGPSMQVGGDGGGLYVNTSNQRLLASHSPMRRLGVRVAVELHEGLVVPEPFVYGRNHGLDERRSVSGEVTRGTVRQCAAQLQQAAGESPGFSYVAVRASNRYAGVPRRVALGYVGVVPPAIAAVVAELGQRCPIETERAIYTSRQLARAERRIDLGPWRHLTWRRLSMGRGLLVTTDNTRLLASHQPLRLLGIAVAAKLREPKSEPDHRILR